MQPEITLEEMIQRVVDSIPASMQYPDITCARVIFKDKELKTGNFQITRRKMSAGIKIHGQDRGVIEIYYLQGASRSSKKQFLKEEVNLINAIAERMGAHIEHKYADKELIESKTSLEVQAKKLDAALKEELRARETLTGMLDDNNRIREELERKLEELKQTQNMLVQTEKLASLGKLVSDMAHEVNNPLMIISGRAQLSLMEELKDKAIEDNLKIITNQCEQAKDIIQRLLMFSKPSKGERKKVDINNSLKFVIELLEHQFSLTDIKIIKNYTDSLPMIKIDEKQIHEVFMNLFKNASEAMSAGGTITVSTSIEDDVIRIDVRDTGSGISGENKKKIFDPFFTTKEQGTGLGLSVCYGIMQAHGGELKYDSKPGKGTTAIITLPIKRRKT